MKIKLILIQMAIAISFSLTAGVKDFEIKQYNFDQEFEGIFIYSIVQNNDGFLWIGADDGLYRFDGKVMSNLNQQDSTIGDLVTSSIVAKDGHLYLGYYGGGISIVEHNKYRKILTADKLPNKVNRLYQDDKERIWGITKNKGIIKYEKDSIELFSPDILSGIISYDMLAIDDQLYIATNEGIVVLQVNSNGQLSAGEFLSNTSGKNISKLYEDPTEKNLVWVGTDEGLYFMNTENNTELSKISAIDDLNITSIVKDKLGVLWVGTGKSGLIEVQLIDMKVSTITNFDKTHGFPSDEINSLYVDEENEVWVGTFGNGLVQLNRSYFHHYELNKSAGIEGINDIYEQNENLYYLGTDKGLVKAFNESGKDSLTFEIIKSTDHLQVNRIIIKDGIAWLGTSNEGLIKYNLTTGSFQKIVLNPVDPGLIHMIRYLVLGNDGNLWVSIAGNGVYNIDEDGKLIKHHNTRNGFYHNEIYAILPDDAGNIWFGAPGVGLALRKASGEIEYLTKDEIFPARDINSISQDAAGNIWIATAGSGLYSFDGETFQHYNQAGGLISDFCNAVEVDNNGQVWVGHRKGLSLIQQEYGLIRKFTHPSELGETEAVLNSVSKDKSGNIWFGNPYGVTKVILPHIQHRIKERKTHIQDIRLFFKNVDLLQYTSQVKLDDLLPDDLIFGHKDNHVSFDFISINLKKPEAIFYQYKLEGFDKTWSPVTNATVATFTNLDPGKYKFIVRESDHSGYWSDDKYQELSFIIDSPYWKKWWFFLMEIMIMATMILVTYVLSKKLQNLLILRIMVYVSLFTVFEYIHTTFEPYIESLAGEAPIFQVGVNLILALMLLPIELKLSKHLSKRNSKHQELAN